MATEKPTPGEVTAQEPTPGEVTAQEPTPGEVTAQEPTPGEVTAQEPTPGEVTAQRERLMDGLRGYGERYNELSRRFAVWLGLHSTDADALLEIVTAEDRGTPLSPARLSKRILLSSGATTALLNRLEGAGHIVRTREHTDRRVVTLRSRQDIRERADDFFTPLAVRMDAAMAQYPPELIERFEKLLADLRTTIDEDLAERDRAPGSD